MFLPNATFWRMWGVALVLCAAFIALCLNARISHAETCRASFYGAESGRRTANGEPFIPAGLTAAHRSMPFGSQLRVTFAGRSVVVRVNDRGPFVAGRCLDLSKGAAMAIGMTGTASVSIERLGSAAGLAAAPLRRAPPSQPSSKGQGMTLTYTADQIANGRTIFDFWFGKTKSDIIAAGWVADADREDSLKPMLIGDKGSAFGIAQDHMPRVRSILAATQIDMRTASVADQCRGIFWEVSKGPYKAILPALLAAPTAWSVNAILISRFEQSGDQSRDLAEQLPKAAHWLATFGGHG